MRQTSNARRSGERRPSPSQRPRLRPDDPRHARAAHSEAERRSRRQQPLRQSARGPQDRQRRRSPRQKRRISWKFVLFNAFLVAAVAVAVIALVPAREVPLATTEQDSAPAPTAADLLPELVEPPAPNTPEPELLTSRPVSEWLLEAKLVAHAGGAYRDGDSTFAYTNAKETLTQNYNLKLRAFEFDFMLTTDGDLACLHDWDSTSAGSVTSSEDWANSTVTTSDGTQLTPMLVSDLLNIMMGLPDMVLVADTKAFQSTDPSEISLVYQRLVEAAKERDPKLLERIVPYVYGADSYEACMKQYDFSCVIYAAYGNPSDTADGIVSFTNAHDNIHGVCVAAVDKRLDSAHIAQLHDAGKKLFTYTINSASAAQSEFDRGVDAVITDSLTPPDLEE